MKRDKNNTNNFNGKKMSRGEAVKKLTALTATTLLFLETKAQSSTSPNDTPQAPASMRKRR